VGDVHEWIYRSRRNAEEQWTRTLGNQPAVVRLARISDVSAAAECR